MGIDFRRKDDVALDLVSVNHGGLLDSLVIGVLSKNGSAHNMQFKFASPAT
jgi:hypothetical protein